jgi:hypothetical protein
MPVKSNCPGTIEPEKGEGRRKPPLLGITLASP